ncbi:MAG: Gp15 family bacteriophage protein [Eubacteriales bacterium]
MNFLIEKPAEHLCYLNRKYSLQCSFDNVLEVQRLYKEQELTDYEKVEQALSMLVKNQMLVRVLSKSRKIELMNLIYEQEIKLPEKSGGKKSAQRVVDFYLDSEYIYSSFRSDYGMDLIQEQGKLHWKEFVYLFQGLSDKTKIKEVIKIRSMEIPKQTKDNYKQIQSIMELKSYYALPVEGGGGAQGLDALFGALEQVATHGR